MSSCPVLLSEPIRCIVSAVENARNRIALCTLLLKKKINGIVLQCAIQSDAEKPVGCATTPHPTLCYLSYSQIWLQGPRMLPSDRRMEFSPKKDRNIFLHFFFILEFPRTGPLAPSRLKEPYLTPFGNFLG
jgi:hypothetical protein